MLKKTGFLFSILLFVLGMVHAQSDNSPYSRYGLGDLNPAENIISRGMGGVSAGYFDFQSVNSMNAATYSKLRLTTFDFGMNLNSRTIQSFNPVKKFTSVNPQISYIQIGIPLAKNWGMGFGLKPLTRINYDIERRSDLGFDSVHTNFKGDGGVNQVFWGTGYSIGNFSAGINVNYLFGSKNYHTYTTILPDSLNPYHYRSNHTNSVNYGGLSAAWGVQYMFKTGKETYLQLGAFGNLKSTINANKDHIVETFSETAQGNFRIDSIYENIDQKGKMIYPSTLGAGFMFRKSDKWMFGADYVTSKWSQYEIFNEKDLVQDSWKLNVGGQVTPNSFNPSTYWGRVSYRAGFSIGEDYVAATGKMNTFSFSVGAGFPMRRANYSNQVSVINTALEFGSRGNEDNLIKENYFRLNVGLTLSDVWFIKRKYD